MNALYKIREEYNQLLEAIFDTADEATGEVDIDLISQLDKIQGEFTEKAVSVATVYREIESEVARFKAEEKRLADIRKRLERRAELVKEYIARECTSAGIERIDGISANISFRSSEKTVIDNEADIPKEYWRVKKEPDLALIRSAIKSGKEVNGAHLQACKNIQIK